MFFLIEGRHLAPGSRWKEALAHREGNTPCACATVYITAAIAKSRASAAFCLSVHTLVKRSRAQTFYDWIGSECKGGGHGRSERISCI